MHIMTFIQTINFKLLAHYIISYLPPKTQFGMKTLPCTCLDKTFKSQFNSARKELYAGDDNELKSMIMHDESDENR